MLRFYKVLFCTILSTFVVLSAFAEETNYDLDNRWGVGVGAGMSSILGSDAFDDALDGGFTGGLWVRYHWNSRFAAELALTRYIFDYKQGGTFDSLDPVADVVDLSVAYRAWPKKRLHALIQLGVGYVRFTDAPPTTDNYDDIAFKGRVGAEYMATPDLALALHADYAYMNTGGGSDSNLTALTPSLALTYYFGGVTVPPSTLVDSDNDGIPDDADKCPNTPANVNVDGTGCPLAVGGTKDTDNDGVKDEDDKCPGTVAGSKVNEFGCAATEKIEFTLNVQFATGSSKLDEQYMADVEKLAEFMAKYPEVKAEIEGHTDNTGSEKGNFSISQKRADSVRKALIGKYKVAKERLTSKGYGPSQPVADNTTAEGRTKNRRVVAHVKTEKK